MCERIPTILPHIAPTPSRCDPSVSLSTSLLSPSLLFPPEPHSHIPIVLPSAPVPRAVTVQTYPPWRLTSWAATPSITGSRSTRGWSTCLGPSWVSSGSTKLKSSTTRPLGLTLLDRCGARSSLCSPFRGLHHSSSSGGLRLSRTPPRMFGLGCLGPREHRRPCATSQCVAQWMVPWP